MKVKKCAFTGHRPQSLPFGFNESDERCIACNLRRTAATGAFASGHPAEPNGHLH